MSDKIQVELLRKEIRELESGEAVEILLDSDNDHKTLELQLEEHER